MANLDDIYAKWGAKRVENTPAPDNGTAAIYEKWGIQKEPQSQPTTQKTSNTGKTGLLQTAAMLQGAGGAAMAAAFSKDPNVKALAEKRQAETQETVAGGVDPKYTLSRFGTGVSKAVQGVGNALSYAGQTMQKQQLAQQAQTASALGTVLNNENLKSGGKVMEQQSRQELVTPFEFADRQAQKVADKYGNVSNFSRIFGDAAEGVGGMLPSLAVSLIPGIGQAAAMAITASGAAGNAAAEAKAAGASDNRALAYGLAVGGVELATEKLVDGLGGVFGKGLADKGVEALVKKAVKNEAAQKAINALLGALGEGAEEFISEYANNLANRLFVNTDQRGFFSDELWDDAKYSLLIGALVGGLVHAGNSALRGVMPSANAAAEQAAAEFVAPTEGTAYTPTQTIAEAQSAPRSEATPRTYERISEAQSLQRASARITRDEAGNITNFEQIVDELLSTPRWNGEDGDLAKMLIAEAAQRNDADTFAALTMKYEESGTEIAQALQARKKWIAESPENIIAESIKALSEADSQTANTAYAEIAALSQEFGKAKTAEDFIKIIRDTAKARRTAGLFGKKQELSPFANWALARVVKSGNTDFLKTFAANSIVAVAEDATKTSAADAALSVRRLSLLSKPATFLRNVISTGVFDLAESGTQNMAAIIDSGLSQITGTRSVAFDKSWLSKTRRTAAADALAKSFLEVALDVDTQGIEGRYGSSANRAFHMSGNPAARLVSTLEKYMGYSLTTSDEFFKGGAEADVFAGLQDLVNRGLVKQATPGNKQTNKRGVTLDAPAEKFPAGTLVKALDRDNFGRVVSYDASTDKYTVHFVSRSGKQADVKLPAEQVQRAVTAYKKQGAANVKPQTIDAMIAEMAANEAAYRTFHNNSALSEASGLLQKAGNRFRIGGIGGGDLAIPFAKTPANVVSAIFDFSPFGLARGAYQLADVLLAAKNGAINPQAQAQAARNLARGLSGTALIAIAKAAAEDGILLVLGNGKDDDDADATALEKMAGLNGTQLNVNALLRKFSTGESGGTQDGDYLLNLSAIEPFGAHFAIGAMIADDITPEMSLGEKVGTFAKDSAYGTLSYLSDLPVASPLGDAVNDFMYSDGASVGERLGDAAVGFAAGLPASFVPNIVKGVAQGTDPYQRNAYTSDTVRGEILDTVKAGIPGLRQTLPIKQDSYGQPMETEGGALGFLNSTVLPGAVTQYREPTAYDMLMDAYESGRGAGVLPERKAPNSITVDSENIGLTAENKQEWQRAAGQKHEQLLAAAPNNEAFTALPADTQSEVLKDLRTSASWDGKTAIGYGDSLSKKEQAIAALGAGDWVSYYAYLDAYNEAADKDATADDMTALETLLQIPMTDSVEKVIMDGDFASMYKLTNAGVSVQDYFSYRDAIGNIKVAPGYSSKPNWQKFNAIGSLDVSDKTKLTLLSDVSESTGEKIRAAYNEGVSLDDAIAYYEAINARNADGTERTKAQKNAAIDALKLSNEAAGILNSALR